MGACKGDGRWVGGGMRDLPSEYGTAGVINWRQYESLCQYPREMRSGPMCAGAWVFSARGSGPLTSSYCLLNIHRILMKIHVNLTCCPLLSISSPRSSPRVTFSALYNSASTPLAAIIDALEMPSRRCRLLLQTVRCPYDVTLRTLDCLDLHEWKIAIESNQLKWFDLDLTVPTLSPNLYPIQSRDPPP